MEERICFKQTSLQSGISSMIGIVNITYGYPVLSKLIPMVHFHLPSALAEEATFRSAALFLLQKYLDHKDQPEFLQVNWQ